MVELRKPIDHPPPPPEKRHPGVTSLLSVHPVMLNCVGLMTFVFFGTLSCTERLAKEDTFHIFLYLQNCYAFLVSKHADCLNRLYSCLLSDLS